MKCLRPPHLSSKIVWLMVALCVPLLVGAEVTAAPLKIDQIAKHLEEVKKRYPRVPEKPFGKGIFAHVRRPSGRTVHREKIAIWAQNPFIAGTQLSYLWGELEPGQGEFQWDIIERDMEPWATAGKKCWIEISTANWRDKGRNRASPGWIYERGVTRVRGENTAAYPVFWDTRYIELWGNFIRAFGKKFDGDPRIEFVSTGGYSSGHEPNLSSRDNNVLMDQWENAGFDGFIASGVYFNKAIKPILTIYADTFRQTPVAQTIRVRSHLNLEINKFAASLKFILISNGLSLKNSNATSRQLWRDRRESLGVRVGFAEWGPAGRRTNFNLRRGKAGRRGKRDRQQGTREERRSRKRMQRRDPTAMAKLMDVYRAAIGDDGDPKLNPWSKLSYLPLGMHIPDVETEEEWEAALRWAWEHLDN